MEVEATTSGIKVSVQSMYLDEPSKPELSFYIYGYRIRIENNGERPIQLLRRFWEVNDSNGSKKTVEGEGVVGKTPEIHPGGAYIYESGCDLQTGLGFMEGKYTCKYLDTDEPFSVAIPRFSLVVPWKLN